ncbi:CPBP family intramembrane glutamic endopeptidase [Methylomagnum sp.]
MPTQSEFRARLWAALRTDSTKPSLKSVPTHPALAVLYPFLYLLACAAIASTVAYPLFLLIGGDDGRDLRVLVSRGGQVFLILGLYFIAKRLRLGWVDLGFDRAFPRQWIIGLGLGVLMLGLHVLGLLALDIRGLNLDMPHGGRLFAVLGKALATGIAVALLEEMIFRGVLFAALRKTTGPVAAVLISAFYYAGLHFLGSKWVPPEVGWDTGFQVAVAGFAHLTAITPDAFLALFVAGVMLGCVRNFLPRGLGYCMGLHAGWVFVIKTAKPLTHVMPNAHWSFLVSGYDRVIGCLSAAWLAVLILVGLLMARRMARI